MEEDPAAMDDSPDKQRPKPNLAAALRAARADDAERAEVLHDLRNLALARLGVLLDALEPVLVQLPDNVDLFDVGLMPGDPPRLFIDMVAFVEMARDRRHYRLLQDRRHGRVVLAEAETLDDAVDAVTAYIARRLIEREKALASDAAEDFFTPAIKVPLGKQQTPILDANAPVRQAGRFRLGFGQAFWFVIEVLGLLALFGLVLAGLREIFRARGVWPGP